MLVFNLHSQILALVNPFTRAGFWQDIRGGRWAVKARRINTCPPIFFKPGKLQVFNLACNRNFFSS